MFSGLHNMAPSDADLANQTLHEENAYRCVPLAGTMSCNRLMGSFFVCRFPAFSASDAVTLVSLKLCHFLSSDATWMLGVGPEHSQTISSHLSAF